MTTIPLGMQAMIGCDKTRIKTKRECQFVAACAILYQMHVRQALRQNVLALSAFELLATPCFEIMPISFPSLGLYPELTVQSAID
jgi:hypothetical protein